MNTFQGAEAVKPLVELALELRARCALPLAVCKSSVYSLHQQRPVHLLRQPLVQTMPLQQGCKILVGRKCQFGQAGEQGAQSNKALGVIKECRCLRICNLGDTRFPDANRDSRRSGAGAD